MHNKRLKSVAGRRQRQCGVEVDRQASLRGRTGRVGIMMSKDR